MNGIAKRLSVRPGSIGVSPFFWAAPGFAAGIVIGFHRPLSFPVFLLFSVFLLAGAFFLLRSRYFIFLSAALFVSIGVLFGIEAAVVPAREISKDCSLGRVVLEGDIITVPETKKTGKRQNVSFVLSARSTFQKSRGVRPVRGNVQVFLYHPGCELRFGDRVRLRGEIERPKKARNFHEFDYARFLSLQGIHTVFKSGGSGSVVFQMPGRTGLLSRLNSLRAHLRNRIEFLLDAPYSELANAFLIGFRKNIPPQIRDEFIKTGTAHLLAISGFHISLIGCAFYYFGRLFFPRRLNILLTCALILAYAVLAGGKIPAVRASVMGALVMTGLLLSREKNLTHTLWVAFFGILIWNPPSLFSASFQLSFCAMGSLLFLSPVLVRDEDEHHQAIAMPQWFRRILFPVRRSVFSSLAVMLGMFPVLIWYFHLFSFVNLIANLLVVPVNFAAIISMLFVLAIDAVSSFAAGCVVMIPKLLLQAQLSLTHLLSGIPFAYCHVPLPHWSFFPVYYGLLAGWILAGKRAALKNIRIGIITTLVLATFGYLLCAYPRNFRLYVFDLGQTPVIHYASSKGSNVLIDTGRRFPSDQAYWILRPYLMANGIFLLDHVLFSRVGHLHAGGLLSLLDYFDVRRFYFPEGSGSDKIHKYLPWDRLKKTEKEAINGKRRIDIDDNAFVTVHVHSPGRIGAYEIRDGNIEVLYIPFINQGIWGWLSSEMKGRYDIVILPHHEYPPCEEEKAFIKKIKPGHLVIHQRPGQENIVGRAFLEDETLCPLLVSQTGGLEFRSDGGEIKIRQVLNGRTNHQDFISWG